MPSASGWTGLREQERPRVAEKERATASEEPRTGESEEQKLRAGERSITIRETDRRTEAQWVGICRQGGEKYRALCDGAPSLLRFQLHVGSAPQLLCHCMAILGIQYSVSPAEEEDEEP